jgi:hypothetical protein
MDLKECNDMETATQSISSLSSSGASSDFSLFNHSSIEENKEVKFMNEDDEVEHSKDDTNKNTTKLTEQTIIPESKYERSNECTIVVIMDELDICV